MAQVQNEDAYVVYNDGEVGEPSKQLFGEEEHEERLGFIKKVYGIVLVQLLITTAVVVAAALS